MRRGFTLIEMLVVIGIIAVLIGTSVGGYSAMTKAADKAKCQELVSNVATALTALYQQEGNWPKRLARNGATDGRLDKDAALAFVSGGSSKYLSLSVNEDRTKLVGHDRFGVLTPWGAAVVKALGDKATTGSSVSDTSTVDDHILHYALDLDGDGMILGADVGGEPVDVRATAIVWCIGKKGGDKGKPWPYKKGLKNGDVYSWTPGQTQKVK